MAKFQIPEPGDAIHLGDFFLEERRFSAVYFLHFRGEVVYVGQSRTLKYRIEQHIGEGKKQFDAVAFVECPFNRLNQVEAHFIRELAPKYNACGLSKKVRQKEKWRSDKARAGYGRKAPKATPFKPGDIVELKTIDASECLLDDRELGELMQVTDGDVLNWQRQGALGSGISLMDMFHFMMRNHREVKAAQHRFDQL